VRTDERTGEVHDYARKTGVRDTWVSTPEHAPGWMADRHQLWNAVEAKEKRKDAQLVREVEVALPRELDADAQRELVRRYIDETFVQRGMAADVAIHDARARDGEDQPHAHILLTMREIDTEKKHGFGAKAREWNDTELLEEWRAAWSREANAELERARCPRIDHRSLEAQREGAQREGDAERANELSREPEPKIGPAAAAMERRGEETERGRLWRQVHELNRWMQEQARPAFERIQEQVRDLKQQIERVPAWARELAQERQAGSRDDALESHFQRERQNQAQALDAAFKQERQEVQRERERQAERQRQQEREQSAERDTGPDLGPSL